MTLTPLLDHWQKPANAGDPVAVVATTFTLEPDFFERSCLARFLAVESVDEGTGSVDDLVARLELEESLRAPTVTVLADRSAQSERSTLRWDVLHCQVPRRGLLHSKVAVLLWENATRVIIGSANLTPAGYRHQIEIALAADLGPHCILPRAVLAGLADELASYLRLVPGLTADVPARQHVEQTLETFRERVAKQSRASTRLKVAFAPTNANSGPLDVLEDAWSGARPLRATHLSPFWDTEDRTVLESVATLLTGRPRRERRQETAVVRDPWGVIAFPIEHFDAVDCVRELDLRDGEARRLHAKCLLLSQRDWVAVLVGSSNHTKAGLGLGAANDKRHREINLWLGAPPGTKEGKALLGLVPVGQEVYPADVTFDDHADDDELDDSAPVLPTCFGLCRLVRKGDSWVLIIGIEPGPMPREWRIALPSGTTLLDSASWVSAGCPESTAVPVAADGLPMFVVAEWDEESTSWAVVADDRHSLPPGKGLESLNSSQLLEALASGKSLAQVAREELERMEQARLSPGGGRIVTDPLKRFDSTSSLLRKGRALAQSLAAMQRRLEHPVMTIDALTARLAGPLGPMFVARKTVDDVEEGRKETADGLFTLAEIALTIGRVNWAEALRRVDETEGRRVARASLDDLEVLAARLGGEPVDLAHYSTRAVREARRCLAS
ncbi:hypothetical protein BN12_2620027 [Nostocoides japonicum T1-X7]|uniref:Uncharacterized protein n=1 Tax=Nostocoides japonicum T1-X7 TaxID=1194083 RepID=A0A077LZA1_9MICO|nr:hypothetical protein [Tetrasphaera japonica]CCH78212.1 hypothetical protein BN12_2620027 [Tetrasphaera japonica T1-X7]